jgi:magnesium-transporting ATPase (P-type)
MVSSKLLGALFLGFIFIGLPGLFFLIPHLWVTVVSRLWDRLILKIEDDEFQEGIKKKVWLRSRNVKYMLIFASILLYFASVLFVLKVDYPNVDSVYYSLLFADLFRFLAWVTFVILVLFQVIDIFAEKTESPGIKMFNLFIVTTCLIILLLLLNTATMDLINGPSQLEGRVNYKKRIIKGRNVEYHLRISSDSNLFKMKGDNLKNGYEAINVGDNVRFWYAAKSKEVILIDSINLK